MDVVPYVRMLVKDASAQVRRECAIALRHNFSPEGPKLWAHSPRSTTAKDRWYLEPWALAPTSNGQVFDAWLAEAGDKWKHACGRDIVWRSRSKKTPALLVKIINDKSAGEKERARCSARWISSAARRRTPPLRSWPEWAEMIRGVSGWTPPAWRTSSWLAGNFTRACRPVGRTARAGTRHERSLRR